MTVAVSLLRLMMCNVRSSYGYQTYVGTLWALDGFKGVKWRTYLDETVLVAERGCCLRFQEGLILKGESILRFPPSVATAAVEGPERKSMTELVVRMILRSCRRSILDISVLGTSAAQTALLKDNSQPPVVSLSSRAPDSRDSLPGRVGKDGVSTVGSNNPRTKAISVRAGLPLETVNCDLRPKTKWQPDHK